MRRVFDPAWIVQCKGIVETLTILSEPGAQVGQEWLARGGFFEGGDHIARGVPGENRAHLGRSQSNAAQAPKGAVAFQYLVVQSLRESQSIQRAGAFEYFAVQLLELVHSK